jgi:hypothetical protein
MKRLLLIAAAALIATEAGAQIDEKKAEEAHQAKKQYAECLARETTPLLDRKYSEATIALMAQEMCPAQAQQFLKTVMDYLAVRIPETASGDHVGAANQARDAAIDDIVTSSIAKQQPRERMISPPSGDSVRENR